MGSSEYSAPSFSTIRKYISSRRIWNIHILSLSIFFQFFFGWYYFFGVAIFKSFFFLIVISFNRRPFISTAASSTISWPISWSWSPSAITRSWTSSVSWSGTTSFTIAWSWSGGSFSSTRLLWTLRSSRFNRYLSNFRFNRRNLSNYFFCNDSINFRLFFLNSFFGLSYFAALFGIAITITISITMAILRSRSGSSFPVFGSWTSSPVSRSGSRTSSIWKSKKKRKSKPNFRI